MTRRRTRALGAIAVGAWSILALGAISLPATAAPAPTPEQLTLVSQEFDLADTDLFVALVALPPTLQSNDLTDGTVVVTSYARVTTRAGVAAAIAGELTRPVDVVEVPITAALQPETNQYLVTIPTEAVDRDTNALQFSRPGLYPVTIELQSTGGAGTVVGALVTFVHRLPPKDDADPDLSIAAAMSADPTLRFESVGGSRVLDVVTDDAVVANYAQLADLLELSPIPVAARVSPTVIQALAEREVTAPDDAGTSGADAALIADRLNAAFEPHLLLSATKLPLDPSAAAAANEQARYTQWFRDGEDILGRVVATPSVRSVTFIDYPLSSSGGTLLRDLGTRLALITPAQLDTLPNTLGELTDSTLLTDLAIAPGVIVPTTVVDRAISERLDQAAADPGLNAVHAVADLLAARQQIIDAGGDPSHHSVSVATSDLSVPDTDTFLAIADLIATTDGLAPVDLDTLAVRVDSALPVDAAAPVGLPDTVDGSMTPRIDRARDLTADVQHVRSMLPTTGDFAASAGQQVAAWNRLVGLIPSSAITDEQVDSIATTINTDLAAIRDAVVLPDGFSFTLTGRSSTLPIKLFNSSDMPLTVQVRVSSLKLITDGPQTVTLEPGQFTDVKIAIEARSNGRSPVNLEVYTPDSGVRLGPAVPLSVKVTATNGLGNLITGAFAIVLLTWWVRHVRQNRRAKAALLASQRHPGAGAATTLPPS